MGPWLAAAGLAAFGLLALLAARRIALDRDAAPEREGEGFLIRPSRGLRLAALALAALALAFGLGTARALLAGGAGPGAALLAAAALAALAAAGWTLRRWRGTRLRYDADGFELALPGRNPRAFRWAELAELRRETLRPGRGASPLALPALVARLPDGATLRIPANLAGFSHFLAHALAAAERLGRRGADRDA